MRLFQISFGIVLCVMVAGGFSTNQRAYAQEDIPDDLEVTIGQFDAAEYPQITLYVNVTDSSGKHVLGLTEDDFSITEDGVEVEISDFAGVGEVRLVDVVYVFDTTGSMADEIDGLIRTSIAFADELESKGRDYSLGLVTFADKVLLVHRSDDTLTEDAEEFKDWVSELVADGGNDPPENDYAALKRALQMSFRDKAQKVFILITDAPVHQYGDEPDGGVSFDDPDLEGPQILIMLKDENVAIYAVTPELPEFTSLASETGGRFYNIETHPDFTEVIEEIGETIANQYRISYASPRPSYDGTRRDVEVKVGEAGVITVYAEQHLLNVQSRCLFGLLCFFPLLAALIIPLTAQILISRAKAQKESQMSAALIDGPLPGASELAKSEGIPLASSGLPAQDMRLAGEFNCQNCGQPLRRSAKFCPKCGQPHSKIDDQSTASGYSLQVSNCVNCGRTLRPGVKFCNHCGVKL